MKVIQCEHGHYQNLLLFHHYHLVSQCLMLLVFYFYYLLFLFQVVTYISIIFDSKNNIFITMAGQSDQTAYVNEQIVLQPIELNNFDKIVVGKTRL